MQLVPTVSTVYYIEHKCLLFVLSDIFTTASLFMILISIHTVQYKIPHQLCSLYHGEWIKCLAHSLRLDLTWLWLCTSQTSNLDMNFHQCAVLFTSSTQLGSHSTTNVTGEKKGREERRGALMLKLRAVTFPKNLQWQKRLIAGTGGLVLRPRPKSSDTLNHLLTSLFSRGFAPCSHSRRDRAGKTP